jgi:hypothetical protein
MWSQTGQRFTEDELDPDRIKELASKKKKKEKIGGLEKNTARSSLREPENLGMILLRVWIILETLYSNSTR